MRIRFIQSYSTARDTFKRGDDHDAPEAEAVALVESGVAARLVSGPPPMEITVDAEKWQAALDHAAAELKSAGKPKRTAKATPCDGK